MYVKVKQKGFGHAVLKARPIIGESPFLVVLPDVILDEVSADLKTENLSVMLGRYNELGHSQIMVESVPMEMVSNYGVADCTGHKLAAGESKSMAAVVEKPPIFGRYVLLETIRDMLEFTPLGAGDDFGAYLQKIVKA